MAEALWYFVSLATGEKIVVVGAASARVIVRMIDPSELGRWQVRKGKDGAYTWVPECVELFSTPPARAAREPSNLTLSETQFIPSLLAPELEPPPLARPLLPPRPKVVRAAAAEKARDKRRHPRTDMRLRVVVIAGRRCFRSFTKNVSQGGIMLEHVIPAELIGVDCRVIIGSVDSKENIEFKARLISHGGNPRSFAFTKSESSFLDRLTAWTELARHSGKRAA